MLIQDLMTRHPVICRPDDSLNQAAQLMWDFDCGCVPIVDERGRLVGMLTDRDICVAAYTQGKRIQDIAASAAMANEVYSCLPDDTIAEAEEIMRAHRVRRLPVIDLDGRLIGLISLNDIAREAVREQTRRSKDATPERVGTTLAAICQPREAKQISPSAL
jgi:CBS domain-containing protein